MKIKAIILSLIFLFGGSGISIDIATCCNKFSSISFGLNAHKHNAQKDCCEAFKPVKKKKCCGEVVIQSPINPYNGLVKTTVFKIKKLDKVVLKTSFYSDLQKYLNSNQKAFCFDSDHPIPIPILNQKRVLQI